MNRDEAIRVMDQMIAAGLHGQVEWTGLHSPGGAQFAVLVPLYGGLMSGDNIDLVRAISDANACTFDLLSDAKMYHGALRISSWKDRPAPEDGAR